MLSMVASVLQQQRSEAVTGTLRTILVLSRKCMPPLQYDLESVGGLIPGRAKIRIEGTLCIESRPYSVWNIATSLNHYYPALRVRH